MPKKRKIVKIDSRTGRTLCVYKSLSEAAVCTGQTRDQIYRCAERKGFTRDSFYWRWPEDVGVRPEQPPQKKDHRLS